MIIVKSVQFTITLKMRAFANDETTCSIEIYDIEDINIDIPDNRNCNHKKYKSLNN